MTFFVFPILQKMWKWRFRVFILIPSRDQKPKKKASAEQKKEKPKKKTSVKQKGKTSKAKEESQREAEERKGEAEVEEVFKEEDYEKEDKTRKEVRMMSSSIGVVWWFNLRFLYIFLKKTQIPKMNTL